MEDSKTSERPDMSCVQRSSLLDQAATFLPKMAAANDALESRVAIEGPEAVNIEAVREQSGKHIAMEVACGVVELQNEAATAAASRVMATGARVDAELEAASALHCPGACSTVHTPEASSKKHLLPLISAGACYDEEDVQLHAAQICQDSGRASSKHSNQRLVEELVDHAKDDCEHRLEQQDVA
jgi:Domain of unknown function (DUF4598)